MGDFKDRISAQELVKLGEISGPTPLDSSSVTKGSFGGAHVFPGGRLDSSDSSPQWSVCIDSNTDVGDTDGLDKFKICAIRETFEETGFLAANKPLDRSELGSTEVHDNTELLDLCVSKNVKLLTSRVKHFSRWITPEIAPKRFDAHFFMLNIDDSSQEGTSLLTQIKTSPSGDNAMRVQHGELMYMEWKTPQEYIDAYCSKKISLVTAQIYMLLKISQFYNYKDLANYALHCDKNKLIAPFTSFYHLAADTSIRIITLPGDHMYKAKAIGDIDSTHHRYGNSRKRLNRLVFLQQRGGKLKVKLLENLISYTYPPIPIYTPSLGIKNSATNKVEYKANL